MGTDANATAQPIATLAKIRLGQSGIAFELAEPSREDRRVVVGSWVVETRKASRVLVARGRARKYATVLRAALPRAEAALDLMSVRGVEDLALASATREHVAWWTEDRGLTVRIVSWATLTASVGDMSVTVRDSAGRLVRPVRAPRPSWHASYRYFRLSQTTSDLFDAYRNAYLALESALSTVYPQRFRGPRKESDRVWFIRALVATGVNLAELVPPGSRKPEQALYDDLYRALRVTVFHAKTNRRTLLPRDEPNRRQVLAGLEKTRRLYLSIVERRFGMRRLGGGVSSYAARMMFSAVFDGLRVFATSDEPPPDAPVANVVGHDRRTVELRSSEVPRYEGFSASRLAWAPFSELGALAVIRGAIGASAKGEAHMSTVLYGDLVLPAAGRLEVLFAATMVNARELRQNYA